MRTARKIKKRKKRKWNEKEKGIRRREKGREKDEKQRDSKRDERIKEEEAGDLFKTLDFKTLDFKQDWESVLKYFKRSYASHVSFALCCKKKNIIAKI